VGYSESQAWREGLFHDSGCHEICITITTDVQIHGIMNVGNINVQVTFNNNYEILNPQLHVILHTMNHNNVC